MQVIILSVLQVPVYKSLKHNEPRDCLIVLRGCNPCPSVDESASRGAVCRSGGVTMQSADTDSQL